MSAFYSDDRIIISVHTHNTLLAKIKWRNNESLSAAVFFPQMKMKNLYLLLGHLFTFKPNIQHLNINSQIARLLWLNSIKKKPFPTFLILVIVEVSTS